MNKKSFPPRLFLGPVPSVLVSCGNETEKNILTIAWAGVVNSDPPMISISVRPTHYSYPIIMETKEFVVNIPTAGQAELADGCGTLSGRELDKFAHFGVTAVKGTLKYAPLIEECPVNLECVVEQTIRLGTHELFLGRVVQTYASSEVINSQGRIDLQGRRLLGLNAGLHEYVEALPMNLFIGFTRKNK